MFKTAYETLACRSYDLREIEKWLRIAKIENRLSPVLTPEQNIPIKNSLAVIPGDTDIPAFTHPFPLIIDDKQFLVIDHRPYARRTGNNYISFTVTNLTDYKFQTTRLLFNLQWLESPEELLNLGELVPLAFCRWLSEAIVRRLGLGPAEQARIMVITLFYWYSLFRANEPWTEKEKLRIITRLNQISAIPSTISMEIVDSIPVMYTINDYITTLKEVVGSVRLDNLNTPLLFAMLGGSWFGLNAKEAVAVALEHPPTFLAIVLSALESRSYQKSGLGQIVHDNDKKDRGSIFTKNAYHVFKNFLDTDALIKTR
jgi:hypothetical protein